MKQYYLTTLLIFLTATSFAQTVSFGPKAGLNVSDSDVFVGWATDNRYSVHVGGFANVRVFKFISLQGEVVYSPQGSTVSDSNQSGLNIVNRLDYINFPLLVDINFFKGLSIQGGPQLGILVNKERKDKNTGEVFDFTRDELIEPVDWSMGFGFQYRFPMGLMIQTRYHYGIVSVDSEYYRTNTNWNISVGWFFPTNKNNVEAKQ